MTGALVQETGTTVPDAGGLDEPLVCTRVEQVTHDVKSFFLARRDGAAPPFEPGQYLTVTVDTDAGEQQRCYTIASPPTCPDLLTLTVKRVPGGPVSGWLHDRVGVGDTLRASGPYGRFSTSHHPAAKYLFLSAGSGITPVMSMSRTLRDSGSAADVVFVHSARSPRDIIFRDELAELAERPGFAATVICESATPEDRWAGATGRLTLRSLLQAAPDLHDREVFTCGPPGYMAAVRELASLAGVAPDRYHEESFDLGGRAPAAPEESSAPAPPRTVEFRRSGRSVECGPGQSILDAALRAGLRPPSMCTQGVCGTCRTTLVAGEVDMQHAGGIRPRDVERGQILLCCSRPLGDVVLDA